MKIYTDSQILAFCYFLVKSDGPGARNRHFGFLEGSGEKWVYIGYLMKNFLEIFLAKFSDFS